MLKHVSPNHVIMVSYLPAKPAHLLLELHFIQLFNYANSILKHYPYYVKLINIPTRNMG